MQANLNNFKPIKKLVQLASVTCIALAIYGCSSTEQATVQEQTMTPEQQQLFILEKIESWSAAEPDIKRVLAFEADMQLIINQLASMAELDDDPLVKDKKPENSQNNNSTEPSVNAALNNAGLSNIKATNNNVVAGISTNSISNQHPTSPLPKMSNNVKTSSKSLGHYFPKVGLHIAMFKDVNSVPLGWQYLQSILPADFVNKRPLLAKVNYEDAEYYSLRVGPFKSVNTAKKMCLNLQQQQHYCSVVEYKGLSFN